MKDFTFEIYEKLLQSLIKSGYHCIPYLDYIRKEKNLKKFAILRHDVDGKPGHSVQMAMIQHRYGVKGTYYFRNVSASFDPVCIREIASMKHEIGFHYEDLAQCQGNESKAISQFSSFLKELRKITPIRTICMHGSPLSKYDNRKIWDHYNYHDFGIEGEPYFDTDFQKVWYLTDTGRSWNNKASVRDKVVNGFDIQVNNTAQLVELIETNNSPEQIMLNLHPQRWTDTPWQWYRELLSQRVKNVVKAGLISVRAQPTFDNRSKMQQETVDKNVSI
jgi:hypothetical protein